MRNGILSKIIIFAIIAVSILVRFYQLGNVPNGISPDEADIGYNAYSILKTGKSIYGKPFPVFFKSFDVNVGGLTIYSKVPAIYLFGLNDFSIRFIPAAFGVLATITIYFFMKFLFPKDKYIKFISTFTFAVSPWAVEISRTAFGHVDIILFYLLSLTFFIFGLKRNNKFLLISALFVGLTLYIYSAAIIYLPLLLIVTGFVYRKKIMQNISVSLLALMIILIISFPAIKFYSSAQSRTRFSSISVFTPEVTLPISISEMNYDQNRGLSFSNFIHNRRFVYLDALVENYLKYLSLDYLFVNAKDTRYFYINNVGLFYLVELPFFLLGLYRMVKRRSDSDKLILGLLVVGPIPAIVTLGTAYPHRALLMLLAIQLISIIGMSTALAALRGRFRKKFFNAVIISLGFVYSLNILFFFHQYFIHTPQEFTSENDNGAWFSTVRDIIPYINQNKNNYQKIIFTWSQGKLVPAIYFLFYNKTNPIILQKLASELNGNFVSYKQLYAQIGKIQFRPIDWANDKNLKNALLIGYPSEFPEEVSGVIDQTYLPDGKIEFRFVEVNTHLPGE